MITVSTTLSGPIIRSLKDQIEKAIGMSIEGTNLIFEKDEIKLSKINTALVQQSRKIPITLKRKGTVKRGHIAKLHQIMEVYGVNAREIALKSGVDASSISGWLNKKCNPQKSSFDKILSSFPLAESQNRDYQNQINALAKSREERLGELVPMENVDKLEKLMVDANFSSTEIEEYTGVSSRTVDSWIKRRKQPRKECFDKVMECFQ